MAYNTRKEKRKTPAPLRFPWGRMLLAVVGSVFICAVIVSMMALFGSSQPPVMQEMEREYVYTGYQAHNLTRQLMGIDLPESAVDPEYRVSGSLEESDSITMYFSLPPQDYDTFIAGAKPFCLILPLQPEGKQTKMPNCNDRDMTISIDKSNAARWHITIDFR